MGFGVLVVRGREEREEREGRRGSPLRGRLGREGGEGEKQGREKKKTKDPRQAYGAVIETGTALARAFRDLPLGVYFSAKAERVKDDATGRVSSHISMPGAKLGAALPYLFVEVFHLFAAQDKESGELERWIQTSGDQRADAKDRSGKLDMYEPADLSHIVAKIRGNNQGDNNV